MDHDDYVVLIDQDGNELEFEFLDTVNHNGHTYAILLPASEEDDEDGEVIIMKLVKDESGDEMLEAVEDENELDEVFEIFKENNLDEFDFED